MWTGTEDRWLVLPGNDGLALFANGLAQSDTLYLATASEASSGTWSFDAGYRNGLLSNFNLMRVYLMADRPSLDTPADGYYLQIGTNDRDLRLYRSFASGNRVLLARAGTELLSMENQALSLTITRTPDARWTLSVDGMPVADVQESSPGHFASAYFGVWVKHTASRRQDMWFDAISVQPDSLGTPLPEPSPYPPPEAGDLVVNEIHYAPPDSRFEFVEMLNRSDRTVDACAVSLADSQSAPLPVCVGLQPIAPGAYAVVARDSAALAAAFPDAAPIEAPSWPTLNNNGDTVSLSSGDTMLDQVAYASSWGRTGVSLERRDPAGPSEAAFNWGPSTDASGATPGRINSLFAPDTTPPALMFAEQTTARSITAVWTEPIAEPTPADVLAGNQTAAGFDRIDDQAFRFHFAKDLEATEVLVAGAADLTGNRTPQDRRALAFLPVAGELRINEIMYEPRADPLDALPDQPEYVEFVNTSGRLLSLRRLTLTGPPDDFGAADSLRSDLAYPTMGPGSYALLFADDASAPLDLAFPSLAASSAVRLPVDAASLRLTNSGSLVRLSVPGRVIDEAIYAPDMHTESLVVTRGIALERRSLAADALVAGNWSSSAAAEGGTPGQPNSLQTSATPSSGRNLQLYPEVITPNGDGLDDALTIDIRFESAPRLVRLYVFDARGRPVRTLSSGTLIGTEAHYFWDGLTDDGRMLPAGLYIVVMQASNPDTGSWETIKKTAILGW